MQQDISSLTEPPTDTASTPAAGPSTGGSPGSANQTALMPWGGTRRRPPGDACRVGRLTEGVDYFIAQMRAAQAELDADPQAPLATLKRSPETRADSRAILLSSAPSWRANGRPARHSESGLQLHGPEHGLCRRCADPA